MLRHHGARLGADCVDMQSVAARQFFGMFYRWSRPGHLVGKKRQFAFIDIAIYSTNFWKIQCETCVRVERRFVILVLQDMAMGG